MQPGSRFNPFKVFVGAFIPNAILQTKIITPSEKLIWAKLTQYAGKNGECFPSQTLIANQVGLGLDQVNRCIRKLEQVGLIEIVRPVGKDRLSHTTNRYFFLWHPVYDIEYYEESPDQQDRISAHGIHSVSGDGIPSVSILRESGLRESERYITPAGDSGLNLETPDPSKLSPIKKKRIEVAFSKFWEAYPRKVNKSKAKQAFIHRWGEMPPLNQLLAIIIKQDTSEEWAETKFIPHPTTWLNGRRWTDELTPLKSKHNYSDPNSEDYTDGAEMILNTDTDELTDLRK